MRSTRMSSATESGGSGDLFADLVILAVSASSLAEWFHLGMRMIFPDA